VEAEDFLFCVCSNELPLQFLCSRVYSEREDMGLSLMSSALHCVPPGEGLLLLCAWQAGLGAMELSSLWLLSSAGSSPLHICAFFLCSPAKGEPLLGDLPPQPRCKFCEYGLHLLSLVLH